jgi:RNA polymerase sigma-70 factor (ECF subfamily)
MRVPATKGGDVHDFDSFYAGTAPSLVRQVHALTGDLAEAQDCVQEAYARAWQRWSTVGGYDAPAAWVRQVACRLAVSRFRRVQVGVGLLKRQGPPPVMPELDPTRVALIRALRQIPEAQRLAIVLHHIAGLSVEEVALETDAPSGTVKARLSRGRAALAVLLADDPEGASHV